ncbi:MAG TPA: uracil-DNA glycosylase [Anaerolineales bacterium]|jgi:DNA polymerase|nr:uracil-DNA glycosylase [Anaerolineales bacterium]
MNDEKKLEKLAKNIKVCTLCELHRSRTEAVPGEGPTHTEIMFIGEGPGASEDKQGRPFVGASGKFLDQLLEQAGVTRTEVFITNVVKCRPPGNRDPLPDEIEICTSNYLEHQIEIINPSIIVTLGRHSMNLFFKGAKITQIHGQMRKVGDRFVIAMFHPAAALHQLSLKSTIMADFARLPELLQEARAELGKDKAPKKKRK